MLKIILITSLCFITLTLNIGCAQKTIFFEEKDLSENKSETKPIEIYYFFDYFGKDQKIYAYKICPYGIHSIENNKTLIDSILVIITVGIITPRTITFKCFQKEG